MRRRDLLRFALGSSMLAAARAGRADAEMAAPRRPVISVFAGVSSGGAQIANARIDTRTDGSADFVTLGADLGAHDVHVFSADNANARFHVWTMILPVPKDQWAYLVGDLGVRMASSIGEDRGVASATFELDAPDARALARQTGTRITERTALDGGLSYGWSNPGGAVKGKPVRIQLRVVNRGTRVVRFAIGGRNEGPRDNRFAFTARRADDGRVVATKDGLDFGGRMVHQALEPGDHVEVEADLRAWIDAPGAYDLDCEYQGELTPDTDDAGRWPDHGAEIWDIAPRATMRVVIP